MADLMPPEDERRIRELIEMHPALLQPEAIEMRRHLLDAREDHTAARAEIERLREEERRQRESAEAAKNGWLKAANEVERLRAELARWEGHDALTKTLVAQAEAERDAARKVRDDSMRVVEGLRAERDGAYTVLCDVLAAKPASLADAASAAAKVIRDHAAERRRVLAERDRLAEQVKRVRKLHFAVILGGTCITCGHAAPCPTIRALDGTEATP